MFYELTEDELRSMSRSSIETLEVWARRLIDEEMKKAYKTNYFENARSADGSHLVKQEIRSRAQKFKKKDSDRYPRLVDTLLLNDLIYLLCKPEFYDQLFKKPLDYIYPEGCREARESLESLVPIRNCLAHANPISVHQAEQAVCYADDFVEGLKRYYKDCGRGDKWITPAIISATDSLGNRYDGIVGDRSSICHRKVGHEFHNGDVYTVHVEMDTSFSADEYRIEWHVGPSRHKETGVVSGSGVCDYTVRFDEDDEMYGNYLCCVITSNKKQHKHRSYDFELMLAFDVTPISC